VTLKTPTPGTEGQASPTLKNRALGACGAIVVLTALVLLLFEEVTFRGRVFFERDIHLVWYPYLQAVRQSIAAGSWPFWNNFISFGQPLWANPAIQILYPTTWLAILIDPASAYIAFSLGHLVFSGFGLFLFAQRLGVTRAGSLISACLWILSGPFLSMLNLWHHFAGVAWFPWVLLATDQALSRPCLRRALLWGATLAAQVLTGSADACAMAALMSAAYAAHLVDWRRPASSVPLIVQGALAWLFALSLSAAQWLPTLDLAVGSERWHLQDPVRAQWSVHPWTLLQVAFPFRWTGLRDDLLALFFESRFPLLSSLYLGMPALALGVASFIRPRRSQLFFFFLVVLATSIALGRFGPFYALALKLFPPLRIFRYPVKVMAVAAFAMAILAGLGFDAASNHSIVRTKRLALAACLAPLTLLSAGFVHAVLSRPEHWASLLVSAEDPSSSVLAVLLVAGRLKLAAWIAGIALVLALLSLGPPAFARPCLVAIAFLAVFDLVAAHKSLNLTADRSFFRYKPPIADLLSHQHFQRVHLRSYLVTREGTWYRRSFGVPVRADPVRDETTFGVVQALGQITSINPPTNGRWRIESSYDFDILGLFPQRLQALGQTHWDVEGNPAYIRLLQMGAVSKVVAFEPLGLEGLPKIATFESLYPKNPIGLFEVPDPLSRCYVVGSSRIAEGQSAISLAIDPSFNPKTEVILPSGAALPPPPDFHGSCTVRKLIPDRVELEARLTHPGYLVLVDTYDPGWRVAVDGRRAPLLRANITFRGVALTPGSHTVEFLYRPWAVSIGASISLGALLVGTALAFNRPRQ